MYSFCFPGVSFSKQDFNSGFWLNSFSKSSGIGSALNFSGFTVSPFLAISIASLNVGYDFFFRNFGLGIKSPMPQRFGFAFLCVDQNLIWIS